MRNAGCFSGRLEKLLPVIAEASGVAGRREPPARLTARAAIPMRPHDFFVSTPNHPARRGTSALNIR